MSDMKTKWKLSDFWEQTLSCTLGTVIGIILTFGTSAWIEYHEKQETERTAAMMVIHNLDSFCEDLEEVGQRIADYRLDQHESANSQGQAGNGL